MTQIVFDLERCFVDVRSGPIELGVTRLDELVQVHAPAFDVRDDLRILNLDWKREDRWLHLAFEPRLIADRNHHACQVRFEYCIARVRLFDQR